MTITTRTIAVLAGALASVSASHAQAQNYTWNNAAGGSWSSPGNWSPFGVPNTPSRHANFLLGSSYVVDIDTFHTEVGSFDISSPGAKVRVHPGRTLTTHDAVMGIDGALILGNPEDADPAQAQWLLAQDTLLFGSGELRLNLKGTGSPPPPIRMAYVTSVDPADRARLTVGQDMTVRGRGQFQLPIINNGLMIAADEQETLWLQTSAQWDLFNTGEIIARNGGSVVLANHSSQSLSVTQTASGRVLADGGTVHLDTTLAGGVLETINGGVIECGRGGISDCILLGELTVDSSYFALNAPGFVNQGLLSLYADYDNPANRVVVIRGDVRIDGEGVVYTEGAVDNPDIIFRPDEDTGGTLTFGPGQLIIGHCEFDADTTIEGVLSPGRDETEQLDELAHTEVGDCTIRLAPSSTTFLQIMNDFQASNDRIKPGFGATSSSIVLGGTLIIENLRGGLDAGESLAIIELHEVTGQFDNAVLPHGYSLSYTPNSVILHRDAECDADMAAPYGVLDFADVLAFLTAFGSEHPSADLVVPFYAHDFADVLAFLTSFGAGCP